MKTEMINNMVALSDAEMVKVIGGYKQIKLKPYGKPGDPASKKTQATNLNTIK